MRAAAFFVAGLAGTLAGAQTAPLGAMWSPGALVQAKVTPEYNTYKVKSGDTLFSIAEQFYGTGHGYWQIIARENDVSPESLKPGMILKIPLEPGKPEATVEKEAPPPEAKKTPDGPTVGDTMDAVGKRVGALMNLLGLRFREGPAYAFEVVIVLFLGAMLYVAADALMVWFGSMILGVPNASFGRASKISISSLGLQLLLVLSLLMIGAGANQVVPDSANLETLRSLSWNSGGVWWCALLAAFLAFFFIPFTMTKQTYGIMAGRATGVILLATALKCFIAFFPSVVAFVATGAGVVG